MTGPYILLGVVIVAFLAIGLWQLITNIRGRKRWAWPTGMRATAELNGFTAHFICTEPVLHPMPIAELARRAALAADCLQFAVPGKKVPKEFAVRLLTDDDYRRKYDERFGTKSNGMLRSIEREAGGETMPLVVCRVGAFASTLTTGSLVIHELLHFLYAGDREHTLTEVWGTYEVSLEQRAQSEFQALVGREG